MKLNMFTKFLKYKSYKKAITIFVCIVISCQFNTSLVTAVSYTDKHTLAPVPALSNADTRNEMEIAHIVEWIKVNKINSFRQLRIKLDKSSQEFRQLFCFDINITIYDDEIEIITPNVTLSFCNSNDAAKDYDYKIPNTNIGVSILVHQKAETPKILSLKQIKELSREQYIEHILTEQQLDSDFKEYAKTVFETLDGLAAFTQQYYNKTSTEDFQDFFKEKTIKTKGFSKTIKQNSAYFSFLLPFILSKYTQLEDVLVDSVSKIDPFLIESTILDFVKNDNSISQRTALLILCRWVSAHFIDIDTAKRNEFRKLIGDILGEDARQIFARYGIWIIDIGINSNLKFTKQEIIQIRYVLDTIPHEHIQAGIVKYIVRAEPQELSEKNTPVSSTNQTLPACSYDYLNRIVKVNPVRGTDSLESIIAHGFGHGVYAYYIHVTQKNLFSEIHRQIRTRPQPAAEELNIGTNTSVKGRSFVNFAYPYSSLNILEDFASIYERLLLEKMGLDTSLAQCLLASPELTEKARCVMMDSQNKYFISYRKTGLYRITESPFVKGAKLLLLNDAQFVENWHNKNEFENMPLFITGEISPDEYYRTDGKIKHQSIDMALIPKELYETLLKRYYNGNPLAVQELGEYLYHIYMCAKLKSSSRLNDEEILDAIDHKDFNSESKYITLSTSSTLKYARKRLLQWIEAKRQENISLVIDKKNIGDLIKNIDKEYESGNLAEAFCLGIEILRHIMFFPKEKYEEFNLGQYLHKIIDIFKEYRDIYNDQTISNSLLQIIGQYAENKKYSELSYKLRNEFREDIQARKITYQRFSSFHAFVIKGLKQFPLNLDAYKEHLGKTIAIEWIEEVSGIWVPDKLIFLDGTKPTDIVYPKKIYDKSLNLTGIYMKVFSRDMIRGRIVTGIRILSGHVRAGNKRFFCGAYEGARARVTVEDKGVIRSIHIGPQTEKRPKDIELKIVCCNGIPLDSYVTLMSDTIKRMYYKYGELEITNMCMTKGPRARTPDVLYCTKYQLKDYSGAPVSMRIGAGGQVTEIHITGIGNLPDIVKYPEIKEIQDQSAEDSSAEQRAQMKEIEIRSKNTKWRLTLPHGIFLQLTKLAQAKNPEYTIGIVFLTDKGIFIFPSQQNTTAEQLRQDLLEWCKKNNIDPISLRVMNIFHINSYTQYLMTARREDPLSYIVLPTIEMLKRWKFYTIFLTWALNQISARSILEYDIKHFVIGMANNTLFYAGYINKIFLKDMPYYEIQGYAPQELLRYAIIRFLPVTISFELYEDSKKAFAPDFMVPLLDIQKRLPPPIVQYGSRTTKDLLRDSINIQELYERNKNLVKTIVNKYFPMTAAIMSYDELVDAGILGLLHAAKNYNPQLGIQFSTYAYKCIRGAILNRIRNYKKFMRNIIFFSERTGRDNDGEEIDMDRLSFMADPSPNPEEMFSTAEAEEGMDPEQGRGKLRELSKKIKHPIARIAFRIHAGLHDGECHSLTETGKILYEIIRNAGTQSRKTRAVTHERGEYTRQWISLLIELAKKEILISVYGEERALKIIEAKKILRQKQKEQSGKIAKRWQDFIKSGLNKGLWEPIPLTAKITRGKQKLSVYIKIPSGPLFPLDIVYGNEDIFIELVDCDGKEQWAVFRLICNGETIKQVLFDFNKKRTYEIEPYRSIDDMITKLKWAKIQTGPNTISTAPSGKVRFKADRFDQYPFKDRGCIRLNLQNEYFDIYLPREYIDQIVTGEFSPGGKHWILFKVKDDKGKIISVYVLRTDSSEKISMPKIKLFGKKLSLWEKENIKQIISGEIVHREEINMDYILSIKKNVEQEIERIYAIKDKDPQNYDIGEHWKALRLKEVIDYYLETKSKDCPIGQRMPTKRPPEEISAGEIEKETAMPIDQCDYFMQKMEGLIRYAKDVLTLEPESKRNELKQQIKTSLQCRENNVFDEIFIWNILGILDDSFETNGKVIYSLQALLETNMNGGKKNLQEIKRLIELTKNRVYFYAGNDYILDDDYKFLKDSLITTDGLKKLIDGTEMVVFMLGEDEREHIGETYDLIRNTLWHVNDTTFVVPLTGNRHVKTDILLGLEIMRRKAEWEDFPPIFLSFLADVIRKWLLSEGLPSTNKDIENILQTHIEIPAKDYRNEIENSYTYIKDTLSSV